MIDPKELRLGNWYNRKHGKGWTPTVITEEIIGGIFSAELRYALEDFEPIPITYELLLQLGFIDPAKNGWGCRISVNSSDEICWYLQDGGVRYQTKLSGFTRELNIKYIHQLQNAYYVLTGEELTVKE